MAIVPLHKAITREALQEFGFVPAAADIVAEANAAVDEKQGSDAKETNLHAMRGGFLAPDPVFGQLRLKTRTESAHGPKLKLGGSLEAIPDPLSVNYRMQTADEAKDAVEQVLAQARNDILDAIAKQKDYGHALKRLGEALHTTQD